MMLLYTHKHARTHTHTGGPPTNLLPDDERMRLGTAAGAGTGGDRPIMSTVTTFLPHNERGPHGSQRRLVRLCVHAYMYVDTYTYVHIRTHTYTYVHAPTGPSADWCLHVCMRTCCLCTHTYCMSIRTPTYIHPSAGPSADWCLCMCIHTYCM